MATAQVLPDERDETRRREEKLVSSICSFQSRLGPPEYRRWRRMHGLQLPLHPMQIGGWFVFISVGLATFLVLVPALNNNLRHCLSVLLSILFIVHIASHLIALLVDPADPELRALKIRIAVPEFDRTKHTHVIENGRCHLCNIRTNTPKTKHCSVCNKCVDKFDHHCKWLNHCVGGRNYVAFIICVISAVLASLVVVSVSAVELVYFYYVPESLFMPLSDIAFLVIVSFLGVLSAISAGLLLHLCLFHCYISILGITTYEYIRNYRMGNPTTCPRLKSIFCRKDNSSRNVGRTLKRQNTDPEFIDRIAKPFVVPIPEEESVPPSSQRFDIREFLKLCPKRFTLDISRRASVPQTRVKNNQVRPTTDAELIRTLEKITSAKESLELPMLPSPMVKTVSQLHEITTALDQAENGHLRTCRRGFKPRPHTPSLSPIRESGFSNPNSPRLITNSPPMSRPATPQISTIFLSNTGSPCTSDEEVSSPVTFRSAKTPEDILQTPQLPRKVYSPKQMFVVQSNRLSVPQRSEKS